MTKRGGPASVRHAGAGTDGANATGPTRRNGSAARIRDLEQRLALAEAALAEALEQQTATTEVLQVIASNPADLQPVLGGIAERVVRLCGAGGAYVEHFTPRPDGAYDYVAANAYAAEADSLLPDAERLPPFIARQAAAPHLDYLGPRAMQERRTLHVHDALAPEARAAYPGTARNAERYGGRTGVAVPLLRGEVAVGAIQAYRREVRPFSEREIALLETFAHQAVIAIENTRLFQELQDRNQDLTEALEQRTAEVRTTGAGPTVLLVDDDPRTVDLLGLYLRGAGFQVVVARDGEAALALARQVQPAVITLDVLLPRLDGWDVLARAKADPALADIPVVVVSMLDERGKGFALGAAEYLVKPVSREPLLAALRRLLPPIGPDASAAATKAGDSAPKALAIDDDPLAIELLRAVLGAEGYTVLAAAGGEEGLALARRELPALVVLDLLMPEVDGFAVVERLRADPRTAAIPIVILTAKTMTAADTARLNGRISFLAEKGEFNRAAFVALVQRLCPAAGATERVP